MEIYTYRVQCLHTDGRNERVKIKTEWKESKCTVRSGMNKITW